MLNCKDATMLFSKRLEAELTRSQRMNLWLHKAMCSSCRNFDTQVNTLSKLTKVYEPSESEKK